jgi:hypothetical protein
MKRDKPSQSRFRWWAVRLGLLAGGSLIGLIVAEIALFALDRPRFRMSHSSPHQFQFSQQLIDGQPFYLNAHSAPIRFTYDGDPRGYFGPGNTIEHPTNSLGFRGPEFSNAKSPGALRLLFLGDSFTFGEGVRFADTYAEVTAELLRKRVSAERHVESYNLGVGGHNTRQSLQVLRMSLEPFSPDIVVLGYVLNDAEPPLFQYHAATNSVSRRPRERIVPEGLGDAFPPESFLFQLRTTKLVWQIVQNGNRSEATVAHYRSLYGDSSSGWRDSRKALRQIIEICRSRNIPFYVVLFPILHELTDDYPFQDIHGEIAQTLEASGGIVIDLFPRLKGKDARNLWVHPTDQHPNETVHRIAAEALVEQITRDPVLKD